MTSSIYFINPRANMNIFYKYITYPCNDLLPIVMSHGIVRSNKHSNETKQTPYQGWDRKNKPHPRSEIDSDTICNDYSPTYIYYPLLDPNGLS